LSASRRSMPTSLPLPAKSNFSPGTRFSLSGSVLGRSAFSFYPFVRFQLSV
jgi:hypothetical protein